MGTICTPLVADLFLFCYGRDFVLSLFDNNLADVVEAFNSTSRYPDDLLNINYPFFEQMVSQLYPAGHQSKRQIALMLNSPNFCIFVLWFNS